MLILDKSSEYFILDDNGEYTKVNQLDNTTDLKVGQFYAVDNTCYMYIGTVTNLHNMPYGTIGRFNDMTILNRYKDSRSEERFSINNVISDAELRANTVSVEDAVKSYSTHFKTGKTVDEAYVHAMSGGDILMPDIHDDDDPFMIAVKTVIRSRGNVIISRYRDKFTEKHAIDNLRTTVLGATQNMSIDRFITWCDILSVNWEISLTDNGTDKNAPLTTDIIINNKNYDNIEIPYPENLGRGYFTPVYKIRH